MNLALAQTTPILRCPACKEWFEAHWRDEAEPPTVRRPLDVGAELTCPCCEVPLRMDERGEPVLSDG